MLLSKKQKIVAAILGAVIAALSIIVIILGIFKKPEPVTVEYPHGSLSDSIFASQNMQYISNDAYSKTLAFDLIPYTIDTVNAECATVDTGRVYVFDNYYFFYSQVPKESATKDILKDQFSQIMDYGSAAADSTVDVILSERGFLDGFTAEYQLDHMAVSSKDEINDAYILSYRMEIDDDDELDDKYDILVAVVTSEFTTEGLAGCLNALDANVYTLQYDPNMAEQLLREQENTTETEETEQVEEPAVTDTEVGGGQLVNETVTEDFKTMGILLKKNYSDLSIEVNWTNLEATPTLVFSDVKEEHSFVPTVTEKGKVRFDVGEIEGGVYMIKIRNYADAGSFSSTLIENAQTGEQPQDASLSTEQEGNSGR